SNELQRSVAIYNYKTTAPSGPLRGEEIYYIKCWMCHNKYTIKAGTPAARLQGLYQRPKLLSGKPVTDEAVAEKIKRGGPAMPAYRYVLSDQDMADLLSYLRDGKCCFEGDEPPRNPRYRY
ncbi:MAG: cytochrome c, partial [Acidobacteria bacterium]|nr:cytochrome c [Acidobacteriota bacterium]